MRRAFDLVLEFRSAKSDACFCGAVRNGVGKSVKLCRARSTRCIVCECRTAEASGGAEHSKDAEGAFHHPVQPSTCRAVVARIMQSIAVAE
jgi:hypothetical protein